MCSPHPQKILCKLIYFCIKVFQIYFHIGTGNEKMKAFLPTSCATVHQKGDAVEVERCHDLVPTVAWLGRRQLSAQHRLPNECGTNI